MVSLFDKSELQDILKEIDCSARELKSTMDNMDVKSCDFWSLPQVPRGTKLEVNYHAEHVECDVTSMLHNAIFPQSAHQHTMNQPKRYLGYIEYHGSESEYEFISEIVEQNYSAKKRFINCLIKAEPDWRKRAEISKSLLGDTLIQTFNRRIALAPYHTIKIKQSWCNTNKAMNKLDKAKVIATIRRKMVDESEAAVETMIDAIHAEPFVYKIGNVKPHPIHNFNSISPETNKQVIGRANRSHSPIIIINPTSAGKVVYVPLLPYEKEVISRPETTKYDFKPIIPGLAFYKRVVT